MGLMPSDWRGFESLRMYKKVETCYCASQLFYYFCTVLIFKLFEYEAIAVFIPDIHCGYYD